MRDEDDLRQQEREDFRLDALRTHLVTMVVYGAGLAVVLFVLLFPRAVAFVAIVALGAFLYARLYRFVEGRLALLDVVKRPLAAPKMETAAPAVAVPAVPSVEIPRPVKAGG